MTGYGNATVETSTFVLFAEVKSLNSKYLDLSLKLPKALADKELEVRNLLQPLERGKVSFRAELQYKPGAAQKATINHELARSYFTELSQLAQSLDTKPGSDLFRMTLNMPEVVGQEEKQDYEEEWHYLQEALGQALGNCHQHRQDEGQQLAEKLRGYIETIRQGLQAVEQLDPERIENLRKRIRERIEKYQVENEVDEGRFEQEMIYYIEKLDITEEKVRLASHLDYFLETMEAGQSSGKKLGFIAQEIGREINTIGSKAAEARIQKEVVQMKDELEKIKEQVLNVV